MRLCTRMTYTLLITPSFVDAGMLIMYVAPCACLEGEQEEMLHSALVATKEANQQRVGLRWSELDIQRAPRETPNQGPS